MEWQPMETAPKDGTPVLVWANRFGWERYGYAMVCAVYHSNQWRIYGCAGGVPKPGKQTTQMLDEVDPTHWMHLPPRPEDTDNE